MIRRTFVMFLVVPFAFFSCNGYLNVKPDKKLTVPDNLTDLQALLDNPERNIFPLFSEALADNYYLEQETWSSINQQSERNIYIWDNTPEDNIGWTVYYRHIYNMNVILEQLEQISRHPDYQWDYVKGTALFFRSYALYELAQIYTVPYNKMTAEDQLGLPLRTTSDIERVFPRASLESTYRQIVEDLKIAAKLLPEKTIFPTRPNRAAAYGMLARVMLLIGDFDNALTNARECVRTTSGELLEYNNLDSMSSLPIPQFNSEVILHTSQIGIALSSSRARVDTMLYNSYEMNDLRKGLFFGLNNNGTYRFKGNYTEDANLLFSGISLSEIYLIIAECEARNMRLDSAAHWLNNLLVKRWKTGSFSDFVFLDQEEALETILFERRKELVFRNRRWEDLRRLNQENRFEQSISRNLNGLVYTLIPNDPRYVAYIPDAAIDFSGISQNHR